MLLDELIKGVEVIKVKGKRNLQIESVIIDSNLTSVNSLFVCISGYGYDGHSFVSQAERYGAVAVVTEKEIETSLTQIIVANSRKAISIIAKKFYSNVADEMKIIGVTGTNGKTTTANLIYNVLKDSGVKCGCIGTLGVSYNDKFIEPTLTTPDPLELHKYLYQMNSEGIDTVVMEVSAHAIYLDKIEGLKFKVGIFTNCTQDHLDFFKDIEEYERAKLKFFDKNFVEYVVTNSDDEVGRKILEKNSGAVSYGIENPSDVFAIEIKEKTSGTQFIINLFDLIYKVDLRLIGIFNVYNALATATVCALLGIKAKNVISSLQTIDGISGRLENVYKGEFNVFVDYAHTPDGLLKVLKSLRSISKKRLICVFGCGGNRDAKKRFKMGEISGEFADLTIITTDNPRFEEPMDIICEIEKGLLTKSKNYVIIQDRSQAINYALNNAKLGDTILIAGKGCERYQEILGIKHLYNDKDTVKDFVRRQN